MKEAARLTQRLLLLGVLGLLGMEILSIAPLQAADLEIEPLSTSTTVLNFDEALSQIVARSTGVAIQDANVGITRARNLPIKLQFVPSLSFDAKQTTAGVGGTDSTTSVRQVEGVSNLNLFRWGADYAGLQAAGADDATQRGLLDNAYLVSEDSGVIALISHLQRKKEVEILSGILKAQADSLAIAEQRYARGYLPLQEVEKVSVDLANARSRLVDAQILATTASTALENLLGHSKVASEWPWKNRFADSAEALAHSSDEKNLAELLSVRPDWRAAQARLDAEEYRAKRSWRLLLPSLDGALSYGYYGNIGVGGAGATGWQGVLSMNFPFFDRLTLYSNARAQAYVQSAAEVSLEQVKRDARQDWDSSRKIFETALRSAVEREKTLDVSRRLYQDNLKRFQSGRISANDLVLDQSRLSESELFSVRGWAQVHLAYYRVFRARGLRLTAKTR